jgi:hypothetical protein
VQKGRGVCKGEQGKERKERGKGKEKIESQEFFGDGGMIWDMV